MIISAGRNLAAKINRTELKRFLKRSIILGTNEKRLSSQQSEQQTTKPEACIPAKYLSAVLTKFSEPLTIEQCETKEKLTENEVLIDVDYCALNPSDALLSRNLYSFTPTLPKVLGYEVVGKVLKAGAKASENGFEQGDKVVALNVDCYGGLAELCLAETNDIWKLPTAMNLLDAIRVFNTYMRALLVLESGSDIKETDILLVNIGLSVISMAVIDLAANIHLGKVIGVCTSEDVAGLARERGAYSSLKFKEKHVLKQIQQVAAELNITDAFKDNNNTKLKATLEPFYAAFANDLPLKDRLYDDQFVRAVHNLSEDGRIIVSGNAIDGKKLESLIQSEGASVTTLDFREIRAHEPKTYKEAGSDVLEFYDEGFLRAGPLLIAGFNHVNDALTQALETKSPLKIVIDMKNKDAEPRIIERQQDF